MNLQNLTIQRLVNKEGIAAYGLYRCTIEYLAQCKAEGLAGSTDDLPILARLANISVDAFKKFLKTAADLRLFAINGTEISCIEQNTEEKGREKHQDTQAKNCLRDTVAEPFASSSDVKNCSETEVPV